MCSVKTSVANEEPRDSKAHLLFGLSIAALIAASSFGGAMLRPLIDRWRGRGAPNSGELALFLEHAVVDVRLGRAAPLVDRLGSLALEVKDPATRERLLGLWTEAALQAGRLQDAAVSEEEREALAVDPQGRAVIRLRRLGLATALGQSTRASELAGPLIAGSDKRLADEARLRLVASMKKDALRSWVASTAARSPEDARRAGLAALRLLDDANSAERLLAPLERSGEHDEGIYGALADVYAKLDRPRDLARTAARLSEQAHDEDERVRLSLLQADALARAGDPAAAIAALGPLRRSNNFAARRAARRAYYDVLSREGRLQAALASVHDPAERGFIALEVQHDYREAVRWYEGASKAQPDSPEIATGLREAARRRELAERRTLYEQVLVKDPDDQSTRDKLLGVLVQLDDVEGARRVVEKALQGRERTPDALVSVAMALKQAGLEHPAAEYLEKAHAAESDSSRKQLILILLGDLYSGARRNADAERLYVGLAADGANPEIRERAVARLATLLH
jgi:tetratricopeptide (TPR) repeat protein